MHAALKSWQCLAVALLSRMGGASGTATTFKLETTVINGVEYATVDQVQTMGAKASSDGAKQGEARALVVRCHPLRRKAGV